MKHASEDIRDLAVSLYKSGKYTQAQVAEIVGYHYKTVANWLRADREGRKQISLPRGHRRSALDNDDLAKLKELVDSGKYHSLSELTTALGKSSLSGVYRALHKLGYTYKKKLFLPANVIAKR